MKNVSLLKWPLQLPIVTTENNITKKGFLPLIATIGKIGDDAFSFYVVLMCALLFFR